MFFKKTWYTCIVRLIWACSSSGRAPALQAGGSAFESRLVHQEFILGLFFGSCAFNGENALVAIKKHLPDADLW